MAKTNKRTKVGGLTRAGKIAIAVIVVAMVVGIYAILASKDVVPSPSDVVGEVKTSTSGAVNISLNEFAGWHNQLAANGGLETKSGSLNAKSGIKVSYHEMNNFTESATAMINGDLQGAGFTLDGYVAAIPQFEAAGLKVKAVLMVDRSAGADGIVVRGNIESIRDLVKPGVAIGMTEYMPSHILLEWLANNSNFTQTEIEQMRKNYTKFTDPGAAGAAFEAGQINVAATWEPYLTNATKNGGKVLFSTANAPNLIVDLIVFREDFIQENQDFVTKYVDNCLQAIELYKNDYSALRESFVMFEGMSDQEIKEEFISGLSFASWADNKAFLGTNGKTAFTEMASMWLSLGTIVDPKAAETAFDTTAIDALASKYKDSQEVATVKEIDQADKDAAQQKSNEEALIYQSVNIEFKPDSNQFLNPQEAQAELDKFVSIAKTLDSVFIQIEGNTADVGGGPTSGQDLSEKRAETVANYLASQGINKDLFIVVGNGASKPVAENNTEEGRKQNRRTDVYFKLGE